MRLLGLLPCLVVLMTTLLSAHAGTVYKSRGADGSTHYSDQAPPKNTGVQQITTEDAPATPLPEAVLRYRDELQKNMQKRLADAAKPRDDNQTILFSAQWCGYCRQAKAYLAAKGVHYKEYDIDTEDGMRAMAAAGLGKSIPVLILKGQRIQGFSAARYDSVFANTP